MARINVRVVLLFFDITGSYYPGVVADSVYHDIIGSGDAWQLVDDGADKNSPEIADFGLRPTISARRVKALIEQITG